MSTSGQWKESRPVPLGAARCASAQGEAHCRHHRCSKALHTLTSARNGFAGLTAQAAEDPGRYSPRACEV